MSDPKAISRLFHDTAWSNGRIEEAEALLAPDLVDHDPLDFPGRQAGAAGLLQVVGMIRAAIPDLRRDVEDQIAEGDTVVTRFVDRGTHLGELLGHPASGRPLAVRGINIEVVRDDRIQEVWHLEDIAGLVAQLGEPAGR